MDTALKRPPLLLRHQQMGAVITEHRGWRIARHFTSPDEEARRVRDTAGLSDWSWISKLNGDSNNLHLFPQNGDSNLLTQTDVRHWVLAPGHYLVTSEDTDRPKLLAKLAPMANTEAGLNLAPPIRWTDVTSVYAALLLAGPRSREILAKLTSLNVSDSSLPDGACAQSGLSHVHAVVLRQDIGGLPAFIVMVGRECAEFVWDSIMHAGHEYEMTAFGVACRSLLGGL